MILIIPKIVKRETERTKKFQIGRGKASRTFNKVLNAANKGFTMTNLLTYLQNQTDYENKHPESDHQIHEQAHKQELDKHY